MNIIAKFTGRNSLGYEAGKEYQLKLSNVKGFTIKRIDGGGICTYQSLSSFMKNWNHIKVGL